MPASPDHYENCPCALEFRASRVEVHVRWASAPHAQHVCIVHIHRRVVVGRGGGGGAWVENQMRGANLSLEHPS